MAQYIVRNRHGNAYHCRLKVPVALRGIVGFGEIRRSLHTTDRSAALIKARRLRVIFDTYIAKIQQMAWTEDELNKHHQDLIDAINMATRHVAQKSPEVAGRLSPDELLELADAIKARQAVEDHQVINQVLDNVAPLKPVSTPQTAPDESNEKTLLGLANERLEVFNNNETLKEASRRSLDLKSAIHYWEKIIGDIPLSLLTTDLVQKYAEGMAGLGHTPGGIKERIDAMKRMLKHYKTDRGKCLYGGNPFGEFEIKLPNDDRKDYEKRECFTSEEVNAVFKQASQLPNRDYRHWMPLLGAYTGARNGELLFLTADAVRQCMDTGIWYFDFKDEFASNGVKFRSVKNTNSARKVPIHSKILGKGFIDFVDTFASDQLIFWPTEKLSTTTKSATQHKRYGKNATTSIRNKVLIPAGVYQANTKTFYSLRHTVINHLYRKGIDLKLIQALVGHLDQDDKEALSGVTMRYYVKPELNLLAQLNEVVNLIDYSPLTRHDTLTD